MVERKAQLDDALNVISRTEPSRIVILGGGGLGKTTLARWILHDSKIVERFKSQRYFLPCEGVLGANALLATLGAMLNIKAAASDMLASVRSLLEASPTLLCLDNFETPWEPFKTRAEIEKILESIADIPNMSLIVTMRGTQRPAKVAWSKPLLQPLSTLSLDGAKSILRNIAGDQPEGDVIDKFLQAIDGIPLAITLASMLLRDGETVESLWRRWSKNHTQIIHAGVRDREFNLDASIFLSVESDRMKNNPSAMKLLAALSLLPSGFPSDASVLENLEKHLGLDCDIDSALQTLRIVALIRQDGTSTYRRIQMLSPIRLYCSEFLSSEMISLALKGVVDYYVEILLRFRDLNNPEAYHLIVPEIPNIHSVFQKGYIAGYSQKSDSKLIATTPSLSAWSTYIGYPAKETIQIALEKSPPLSCPYADLLMSLGSVYRFENDNEKAEELFREAVTIFRQHHFYRGEAWALSDLGNALVYKNQSDEAAVAFEASLELFRTKVPGDLHGRATVFGRLGDYNMNNGQFEHAQEYFTNAVEASRKTGDFIGQSNGALSLCILHIRLGNLVEAEEFATTSLDAAKGIKYGRGEGRALWERGRLYLLTGRITDARRDLEQAVPILKKHSTPINWLRSVNDLGSLYIQLDQLTTGEALLTESIKMKLDSIKIPAILSNLGWLYIYADRPDKAEPRIHEALKLFQNFDYKYGQALVLIQLGHLYIKTERLGEAATVLESIPDSMGIWENVEMQRLWVLGDLYIIEEKLKEGESTLNSAMDFARSYSNSRDIPRSWTIANILRSMGTLHIKQGRIDFAIEKFKEALELHQKSQWISEQATDLKRLGEAYRMLGRSEEAETAFKDAKRHIESVREARTIL